MEGIEMATYEVKTFDLLNAVAKFNRTYSQYVNSGYTDDYARVRCNAIEATLNALCMPVAINGCGRMYIKED